MDDKKILLFGATGAVGGEALKALLGLPGVGHVTVLGRRTVEVPFAGAKLVQAVVDLADPSSYAGYLTGPSHAVCALGLGQPSKVSREEFVRVDLDLVLGIARACREAGVAGFSMLSALGADARSLFFYPRVKGRLEEGLRQLNFERLWLFRPSMILTPTNRYDWTQGFLLKVWPRLNPLLIGPLTKARGVRVEALGRALALSALAEGEPGTRILHWADFERFLGPPAQ
jgi:uncharacterized protein YbjT (DUF2867 family)